MTGSVHLVLIGLMGAGKTTVGRRCAAALGRGFVDTDDVVTANAGMSVPEIFAVEGESGFRARERTALTEIVASPDPLVVACGGGAMIEPENRRAVRDHSVVWLQADPSVLAERVGGDAGTDRPLLADGSAVTTLARLRDARAEAYAAAADHAVETDGRSLEEVADAVLAACQGPTR